MFGPSNFIADMLIAAYDRITETDKEKAERISIDFINLILNKENYKSAFKMLINKKTGKYILNEHIEEQDTDTNYTTANLKSYKYNKITASLIINGQLKLLSVMFSKFQCLSSASNIIMSIRFAGIHGQIECLRFLIDLANENLPKEQYKTEKSFLNKSNLIKKSKEAKHFHIARYVASKFLTNTTSDLSMSNTTASKKEAPYTSYITIIEAIETNTKLPFWQILDAWFDAKELCSQYGYLRLVCKDWSKFNFKNIVKDGDFYNADCSRLIGLYVVDILDNNNISNTLFAASNLGRILEKLSKKDYSKLSLTWSVESQKCMDVYMELSNCFTAEQKQIHRI